MEDLRALASRHAKVLLGKANVVGVGVGCKETGGRRTQREAVVVLVRRKMPPSRLRRADLVPRVLSDAATDVVEVGDIRLLPAAEPARAALPEEHERRTRVRPARPGVSVGHYQVTAGTFGALVYDRRDGRPMVLSNNHVLANLSNGRDGRAEVGDPIYQPGRYDGGTADDTIAHLERFVPIIPSASEEECPVARRAEAVGNFVLRHLFPGRRMKLFRATGGENLVDAAVATLVRAEDAVEDILGLGRVEGVAEPVVGLGVVKSGRTSGVTTGEIRVIGATVKVGLGEVGTAVFTDQIVTTAMAEPGDSGSLLLTAEGHEAVGLLSAGSSLATVHSRIGNVLDLLGVTF
ncbi:MAG TPA: hypothetical protein DHW14_07645 [Clostridiales bacterium]|nr:hypothetical protein [Clostridiales bacterium]